MTDHALLHPQQLAPLLRALRRASGLSQAELAARLGVSHQAISQLEKNPERATLERLLKVLAVLRVDLLLRSRDGSTTAPGQGDW